RRTDGSTIDSRGANPREEAPIKPSIPRLHRPIAALVIQHPAIQAHSAPANWPFPDLNIHPPKESPNPTHPTHPTHPTRPTTITPPPSQGPRVAGAALRPSSAILAAAPPR